MAHYTIFLKVHKETLEAMNKMPQHIRSDKLADWEEGNFNMNFTGVGWLQSYNIAVFAYKEMAGFSPAQLKNCFRIMYATGLKEVESDLKKQLFYVMRVWQDEDKYEAWLRRVLVIWLKGNAVAFRVNRQTFNKFVKKFNYDPSKIPKGSNLSKALEEAMRAGVKDATGLKIHLFRNDITKSDVVNAAQVVTSKPKIVKASKIAKKERRAKVLAARDVYVPSSDFKWMDDGAWLKEPFAALGEFANSDSAHYLYKFCLDIDHIMLRFKKVKDVPTLGAFLVALVLRAKTYWNIDLTDNALTNVVTMLKDYFISLVHDWNLDKSDDTAYLNKCKAFAKSYAAGTTEASDEKRILSICSKFVPHRFDTCEAAKEYASWGEAPALYARDTMNHIVRDLYLREFNISNLLGFIDEDLYKDVDLQKIKDTYCAETKVPSSLADVIEKFKVIINESAFADELFKFVTSGTLLTLAYSFAGIMNAKDKLQTFLRHASLASAGVTSLVAIAKIVDLFTTEVLPFVQGDAKHLTKSMQKCNVELLSMLHGLLADYSFTSRWKLVDRYCQEYGITIPNKDDEHDLIAMEKLIMKELHGYVYSMKDESLGVLAYKNLLGRWSMMIGQRSSVAGYRPQTLNALIYGESGTGKTDIARTIGAILASVYKVAKEQNAEGKWIRRIEALIMETTDNYPFDHVTELDWGLFFDDLGTTKADQERQAVFVLMMIQASGVRACYAKSDVAEKGKVPINNKYAILTSNFRNCAVTGRISNPEAFLRRINIAIEPFVTRYCLKCDCALSSCRCSLDPVVCYVYNKFNVEWQKFPQTDYDVEVYTRTNLLLDTTDCEYCLKRVRESANGPKYEQCMKCATTDLRRRLFLDIETYANKFKAYQEANVKRAASEAILCPACDKPVVICRCQGIEHYKPTKSMSLFGFKTVAGAIMSTLAEDLFPIKFLPWQLTIPFYLFRYIYEVWNEVNDDGFYDVRYVTAHAALFTASSVGVMFTPLGYIATVAHLLWNFTTLLEPADVAALFVIWTTGTWTDLFTYYSSRTRKFWNLVKSNDPKIAILEVLRIALGAAALFSISNMFLHEADEKLVSTAMNDPITQETKEAKNKLEEVLDLTTPQGQRDGLFGDSLSDWQNNRVIHTYRPANGTIPAYVPTTLEVLITVKTTQGTGYVEAAKATYVSGNVILSRHLFDKFTKLKGVDMLISISYKKHEVFKYNYKPNSKFIHYFDKDEIDMVYFPANLNIKPAPYEEEFVPQAGDVFMIHTLEKGTILAQMNQMTVDGVLTQFTHPTFVLKIKGEKGYSGASVYLISRKADIMPTLVGVIGGYRESDQSIIFQTLPKIPYVPHSMLSSSEVRYFYNDMYNLDLNNEIHKNSILTHLPEHFNGGEYVGSLKKPINSQKTKLKPTIFSHVVEEIMPEVKQFKPAPLQHRLKGSVYVNDKGGKLKVQTTAKRIIEQKPLFDAVDIIVKHYLEKMDLDNLKPYTLDQAIRGIPGIFNPINRASSCGAFIPGVKELYVEGKVDDYTFNNIILDKVRAGIEFIDKHGFYVITTDMSLKDELTKLTKIDNGLCRGFNGTDLISIILLRMYLGPFYTEMMRIRKESFAQVGINATGKEFKEMLDHMCESMGRLFDDKAFMDGDFKYFDNLLNVLYFSMKVIYDVMKESQFYKDTANAKHLHRLRVLVSAHIRYVQIIDNDVIIMDTSMPSGMVGTASINCISEGLYEIVIYCVCDCIHEKDISHDFVVTANDRHPFFSNLALKNFGDDNHKMVSKLAENFYVHDSIQLGAKFLGVELTPAQKDKTQLELMNVRETSFLKRTPYEHPDLGWVGQLEELSVAKSLYYTDSTSEYWTEQVLPTAYRELALHGREVYNKWLKHIPFHISYEEMVKIIFDKPLWYADQVDVLNEGVYIKTSASVPANLHQTVYIKADDAQEKEFLNKFVMYAKSTNTPVTEFLGMRVLNYPSMYFPDIALEPGAYITTNCYCPDSNKDWQRLQPPMSRKASGGKIQHDDMTIGYYGLANGNRGKIYTFQSVPTQPCIVRISKTIMEQRSKPQKPKPLSLTEGHGDTAYRVDVINGQEIKMTFEEARQSYVDLNLKVLALTDKIRNLTVIINKQTLDAPRCCTRELITNYIIDFERTQKQLKETFEELQVTAFTANRLKSYCDLITASRAIEMMNTIAPPPPEPTAQKRA